MTVSDEELARARGVSVEQARLVRESQGTTNETLEALPRAAFTRAQQRLVNPDRPALRAELRFLQGLGEGGSEPPIRAVETAVNELGRAVAGNAAARVAGIPTKSAGAGGWEWLGPGNVGGRTRGILIHPGQPHLMWAVSAGGGVWHTRDSGVTWTPAGGFLGNLACSCIAMHPGIEPGRHPTIYVGTGEGFGNVDAIAGGGVFATSDGLTWAVLPATQIADFRYINRIAVSASGVLLVAAAAGIMRSDDAARTVWTKVLAGTRVADVKFDPRHNGRAVAGGATKGEAWYTTDGGLTWTAVAHQAQWQGRVELAYAAKNPDIVYASVQMAYGEIWRSTDGGATFQPRRTRTTTGVAAAYLGDQGWYGNTIWAGDPTDDDLVIVGGINLWRSTDGGDVLAEISSWHVHPLSPHADQHAIVAHPAYDGTTNRTVFFGNDGGVCAAPDLDAVGRDANPPYQQGWVGLSNTLGVTQFYGGAGNPTSGKIVGGAQDNGTLCYDPKDGPGKWKKIFGGDGGWCAADPSDPNVFYGEYTRLNIHRNTDGGTTDDSLHRDRYISGQFYNFDEGEWDWKPPPFRIGDAMPAQPGRPPKALFIAPFVLDPNEPDRILAGGVSLWRTNDAKTPNTNGTGPSWQATKAPIGPPETRGLEISALAVATGDSDTVWVGHANGAVFRTGDGTAQSPTWQAITAAPFPPQRYCTCITVDPVDKAIVYIAFGGYERGNLWTTRDGGTTWSDLAATLPTAPVRAIAVHSRRREFIYAGTEVGLFASEDSGTTWSPTDQGPTGCSVDDLFWMGETLVCVTHGRGMYRIDLSNP